MELRAAFVRSELERVYNECDGTHAHLAHRRPVERRRVWTRRRAADDHDRRGSVLRGSAHDPGGEAVMTRVTVAIAALGAFAASAFAENKKLTDDQRIELMRGLTAEYATVKAALPRSKKALEFDPSGTWDKDKW